MYVYIYSPALTTYAGVYNTWNKSQLPSAYSNVSLRSRVMGCAVKWPSGFHHRPLPISELTTERARPSFEYPLSNPLHSHNDVFDCHRWDSNLNEPREGMRGRRSGGLIRLSLNSLLTGPRIWTTCFYFRNCVTNYSPATPLNQIETIQRVFFFFFTIICPTYVYVRTYVQSRFVELFNGENNISFQNQKRSVLFVRSKLDNVIIKRKCVPSQ